MFMQIYIFVTMIIKKIQLEMDQDLIPRFTKKFKIHEIAD